MTDIKQTQLLKEIEDINNETKQQTYSNNKNNSNKNKLLKIVQ